MAKKTRKAKFFPGVDSKRNHYQEIVDEGMLSGGPEQEQSLNIKIQSNRDSTGKDTAEGGININKRTSNSKEHYVMCRATEHSKTQTQKEDANPLGKGRGFSGLERRQRGQHNIALGAKPERA